MKQTADETPPEERLKEPAQRLVENEPNLKRNQPPSGASAAKPTAKLPSVFPSHSHTHPAQHTRGSPPASKHKTNQPNTEPQQQQRILYCSCTRGEAASAGRCCLLACLRAPANSCAVLHAASFTAAETCSAQSNAPSASQWSNKSVYVVMSD
jgi:hypothetical protein